MDNAGQGVFLTMKLGISADGRQLTYDAARYEFRLAKQLVSFDDMRALESRDWIRWRAPELREWFMKIDRESFLTCNRTAAAAAEAEAAAAAAAESAAVNSAAPIQKRTSLLYRSSDPTVATVDANGRVFVRGEGVAEIVAARADDTGFSSPLRLVTIVSENTSSTREVRESFKSKGGSLPKAKSFKLPKLPSEASGYEKVSGSDSISVSASGKVTVEKGAKRGLHTAEVAVRGASRGAVDFTTTLVSVEVK